MAGPKEASGPSVDRFITKEDRERLPLSGRRLLITGGSSGIGLLTAEMALALGADVTIGASSENSTNLQNAVEKLNNPNLKIFAADFSNPDAVDAAIDKMVAEGNIPTDLIHCAAGGMDSILQDSMTPLRWAIRRKVKTARDARLVPIRLKIEEELEKGADEAKRINFESSVRLFERMATILPEDAEMIYDTSLWASMFRFYPQRVGRFYHNVAGPKSEFEQWMEDNAQRFADMKKYFAVVSGHVVKGTRTGGALSNFIFGLLPRDKKAKAEEGFITTEEMVGAKRDLLESDPKEWGSYPKKKYVFGPNGQVADEFPMDDPRFSVDIPLPPIRQAKPILREYYQDDIAIYADAAESDGRVHTIITDDRLEEAQKKLVTVATGNLQYAEATVVIQEENVKGHFGILPGYKGLGMVEETIQAVDPRNEERALQIAGVESMKCLSVMVPGSTATVTVERRGDDRRGASVYDAKVSADGVMCYEMKGIRLRELDKNDQDALRAKQLVEIGAQAVIVAVKQADQKEGDDQGKTVPALVGFGDSHFYRMPGKDELLTTKPVYKIEGNKVRASVDIFATSYEDEGRGVERIGYIKDLEASIWPSTMMGMLRGRIRRKLEIKSNSESQQPEE